MHEYFSIVATTGIHPTAYSEKLLIPVMLNFLNVFLGTQRDCKAIKQTLENKKITYRTILLNI